MAQPALGILAPSPELFFTIIECFTFFVCLFFEITFKLHPVSVAPGKLSEIAGHL
jgi:hypothetical protein